MPLNNFFYDDEEPAPEPPPYVPPSPPGNIGPPVGPPATQPPGAPPAPPAPFVPPGGGGGGPGMQPPGYPTFNIPGAPQFNPTPFVRPTLEQAQNEPGYRFRLNSGVDALERSKAAQGSLRTGGTLTDVLDYGQNFAAQEYDRVLTGRWARTTSAIAGSTTVLRLSLRAGRCVRAGRGTRSSRGIRRS